MGIFNFLKKKEFEEIKHLKSQLDRYRAISDIEVEVENQKSNLGQIISTKNTEIKNIETEFSFDLSSRFNLSSLHFGSISSNRMCSFHSDRGISC